MSLLGRLSGRDRADPRVKEATSTIAPSPASLHWFLDKLQAIPEPSVLDLGTGQERQVMSLLSLGFRVTADDTVASRLSRIAPSPEEDMYAIAREPSRFFHLDLPEDSHDGVLAWSCFDRLSYLGGFLLAAELARILKVGGSVTGTWSGIPEAARRIRGQVRGATLIAGRGVHPMRFLEPQPCRYEVREILDLFPGFSLVHSMVYVDGTRRVLMEKTAHVAVPMDGPTRSLTVPVTPIPSPLPDVP